MKHVNSLNYTFNFKRVKITVINKYNGLCTLINESDPESDPHPGPDPDLDPDPGPDPDLDPDPDPEPGSKFPLHFSSLQ